MLIHKHRCPVSWYLGNFFAEERLKRSLDPAEAAAALEISEQHLQLFETGKIVIEVCLLLRMEKFYRVDFNRYKPPVSYYGFLGLQENEHTALLRTKRISKILKRCFNHTPHTRIENALLRLRFSPIRGRVTE